MLALWRSPPLLTAPIRTVPPRCLGDMRSGLSALCHDGCEWRVTDLARCLVGTSKIVTFDEPGGGLSREEANRLGDLILQVPALLEKAHF